MNDPAPDPPLDSLAGALPIPAYVLDHGDPAALFTRLQRTVIHLQLLQQEAVKGSSVTFHDFVILATLRKEPAPHELPVSRIAEYVLRPMGSISQALDRVERAGLIARRAATDDRRKVIVSLTPEGIDLADELLTAYAQTRSHVFDRLTQTELTRIDEAITTLLGALDSAYQDRSR